MLDLKPNQFCSLKDDKQGGYWWENPQGQLHRVDENGHQDGPAYINATLGFQFWIIDGKWHRLDGPARIYRDGDQMWYINGDLHRLDGPALIETNGDRYWYLDGEPMTQEQWAGDPRVIEFNAKTEKDAEQWLIRL